MRNLENFVVYEGYDYIDDFYILKESLIEEVANIDLYHILKNTKKSYNSDMNLFYEYIENGDIKNAKKTLDKVISNLNNAKNEIIKIDDTAFSSKIGSVCIKIFGSIGKIGMSILSGFGVSIGMNAAANKIVKASNKELLSKGNLKKEAIMAVIMAIPDIVKEMDNNLKEISKRKEMIEKEIRTGADSKEAKRKIGNLYKSSILNYIQSLIKETNKIRLNLK